MKIYFAASISGGRQRQPTMQLIVDQLQKLGNLVLSAHIADPNVLDYESRFSAQEIFQRDVRWIRESNGVVAEVSTPSFGVGYEICYALQLGKPVLCLCESGIFLSAMLTGNTSEHLKILRYRKESEIAQLLRTYFNKNQQVT